MRTAILFALAISGSGCSAAECQYYADAARDDVVARRLEGWADATVFPRRFASSDLVSDATLVGPGRRSFSHTSGVAPPPFLRGPTNAIRRVRPVGPDESLPAAIFIGERSFAGLIIARHAVTGDLASAGIDATALVAVNGRVGVMCRNED